MVICAVRVPEPRWVPSPTGSVAIYRIEIQMADGTVTSVWKRFAEVSQFHKDLEKAKISNLPTLPGRRSLLGLWSHTNKSVDAVAKRQKEIEVYFNEVIARSSTQTALEGFLLGLVR
eukprot:PhF_6_TR8836/c0_g1_i1/m.14008